MATPGKGRRIAGWVIHGLIGAMMLMAGIMGLSGATPPPEPGKEVPAGLASNMKLIGAGAAVSGVLLLVPQTSSLGFLLATAFWGGTICFHLTRGEPYAFQSVLLALTWVGGFLRDPATYASFTRRKSAPAEGG